MVTGWLLSIEQAYSSPVREVVISSRQELTRQTYMAHFEPISFFCLLYLSIKMELLIAISSARRIRELQALMADLLYTVTITDKYPGEHTLNFSKIATEFHLNQQIHLLVFF